MPTALVTGSFDRVPEIAIALKSQGFDILAAGGGALENGDLEPRSIDCYVQLPGKVPEGNGSALSRTRAVIAGEMLARFDVAALMAPLLAPSATVVLVADGGENGGTDSATVVRTLVGLLAEAILRDSPVGVQATVVDDHQTATEIAALARGRTQSGPTPWWLYSEIDSDLDFADWRNSMFCLSSARS